MLIPMVAAVVTHEASLWGGIQGPQVGTDQRE